MSRVFLDTNFLIYLVERNAPFTDRCKEIIRACIERDDEVFVSALTVGELMVGPFAAKDQALIAEYESIFINGPVKVVDFGLEAAQVFANLRATQKIPTPDAIHLACAAVARTDLFISNDITLTKKIVPGIQFICTPDTAPL
ncbi:MAG TPA: type II toxin-antitoxin system VapC family toxin [Fimbriimonas sp.]|nr:type II toxin-antitoxin system VapC family toxin [Fimbriimonas sp.]